jgi:predicted AAA+ superfamily ATPase
VPGRPGTPSFGRALEHLIDCELRAWQEYRHDDRRLTFWRARDGSEVDFVIGDEIAIEVKGSPSVTDRDLVGLRRLAEETSLRKSIVVSLETAPRRVGAVDILPAPEFLHRLWDGAIA